MGNNRIYYSQEAAERAQREQTTLIVIFLSLGVVTGAALALLFAPKPKKPTLGDVVEDTLQDTFHGGQKATEHAFKRLEKEFNELKKTVEHRVKDIR